MLIPLRDKTGAVVAHALVDDDTPETITKYRWGLNNGTYAIRHSTSGGRKNRTHFLLHREVLGLKKGDPSRVDHINGNTLDNRRENLRLTNASQNAQNRPVRTRRGTYRGVTWKKDQGPNGKWLARATINYKTHHIGYFEDEEEAAWAVVNWRREHMTHSTHDEVAA